MSRHFNVAGPCNPEIHYMVPALRRLPTVRRLIDQQGYFVLHAPRQVGKTTSLTALARELTREGRYAALLVSMQPGAPFPDQVGQAEQAILEEWRHDAGWALPRDCWPPPWPDAPEGSRIMTALDAWARACPRPLVLFLDEIDALKEDALLSILSQIRSGHRRRPGAFPWSLALVGLRDVRDYKIASGGSDRLHSSSPFNIKVESLTMRNFTREEVAELYAQHTEDTGQRFEPAVIDRVFELTLGQPWLVNALARQMVETLVPEPAHPVTLEAVDAAKEILIRRRDTHLDSLAERLREERVRRIVAPMLAGEVLPDIPDDDRRFVLDLGLMREMPGGGLEIANPIYREVIPRVLIQGIQLSLGGIQPTWLRLDGELDPDRLLEAFLEFWRRHGEALFKAAPYHEIAPHLVMMAFLSRVENGGGRLEREYAVGSGRLDLLLIRGRVRLPIELKVWRPEGKDPLREGLTQIDGYMAGLGLELGWLVIFDRRPGLAPVEDRISVERVRSPSSRAVVLIRA